MWINYKYGLTFCRDVHRSQCFSRTWNKKHLETRFECLYDKINSCLYPSALSSAHDSISLNATRDLLINLSDEQLCKRLVLSFSDVLVKTQRQLNEWIRREEYSGKPMTASQIWATSGLRLTIRDGTIL